MAHGSSRSVTIFSAMPPCSISSPLKTKNGIARNEKTFIPDIICWKSIATGSALVQDGADGGEPDREGDRHPEEQEGQEDDAEDRQCHARSTSVRRTRAIACSTEKRTMSTPEITSGT